MLQILFMANIYKYLDIAILLVILHWRKLKDYGFFAIEISCHK